MQNRTSQIGKISIGIRRCHAACQMGNIWCYWYHLLNDKDVAKKDNIGVVENKKTKLTKLSLFDLGYASPDEFELDPKTLLPKSKSKLADFFLWVINLFTSANSIPGTFYFDEDIEKILSAEEREEAISELLRHKNDILDELENIKEKIDEAGKNVVEDMERRIKARFKQLDAVLEEHSKIEAKEAEKFAKDHFVKKNIAILDIPEDDIEIEEIPD